MKLNYVCKKKNSPRSSGFTLIELLTVIAIIGILAAILIPVVGSVRASARTAKCISNVRQITIAVIMFGDEEGRLPYAASRSIDPNNPQDLLVEASGPLVKQTTIRVETKRHPLKNPKLATYKS